MRTFQNKGLHYWEFSHCKWEGDQQVSMVVNGGAKGKLTGVGHLLRNKTTLQSLEIGGITHVSDYVDKYYRFL